MFIRLENLYSNEECIDIANTRVRFCSFLMTIIAGQSMNLVLEAIANAVIRSHFLTSEPRIYL